MSVAAVELPFSKMHGAGNDFVVLDCRQRAAPDAALVRRLADRHFGIGCDQLLTIEAPRSAASVLAYGIWNTDGSAAGQCGNGARCVAAWARRAGISAAARFWMDSPSGPVEAWFEDGDVAIDMGRPDFEARSLPFDGAADAATIAFSGRNWMFRIASMGNPHAVIEVDSVVQAPVVPLGRALQADPRFADSCNVGFAEVVDRRRLRLRVYERGVGETLACGSGACAAVAVLIRAGRLDREVEVQLPGGVLHVAWPDPDSSLRMRGPATFVFDGVFHS